jgi:biotin transport system substrate-specific component
MQTPRIYFSAGDCTKHNSATLGILMGKASAKAEGYLMQSTLPIRADTASDISRSTAGKVFLAVGSTAFVALCAHISFPLYFTPVPVTLQTLAVVMVGLMLGPAMGFSALALYLAEGAMGMPVFSPQGPGGIAQMGGPTGGFLLAYPLAAAAAGYLVRLARTDRYRLPAAMFAGCVASILILTMGAAWFGHLLHFSPGIAWHLACVPFLPGECAKIGVAAAAYTSLHRWRQA